MPTPLLYYALAVLLGCKLASCPQHTMTMVPWVAHHATWGGQEDVGQIADYQELKNGTMWIKGQLGQRH